MVKRKPQLQPNVVEHLRLTIPAREALERAGNRVSLDGHTEGAVVADTYAVEVVRPPSGLVLCLVVQGGAQHHALRLEVEPPYPGEWVGGIAWNERGEWTPCPECGHALLWCEAGYVPGWRVCLAGHACQLSDDGRNATRHPEQDAATMRATRPL